MTHAVCGEKVWNRSPWTGAGRAVTAPRDWSIGYATLTHDRVESR